MTPIRCFARQPLILIRQPQLVTPPNWQNTAAARPPASHVHTCLTRACTAHVHAAILHPQEEVFSKREEALKKRDLELQESLIRFSKFLQARVHLLARASLGWRGYDHGRPSALGAAAAAAVSLKTAAELVGAGRCIALTASLVPTRSLHALKTAPPGERQQARAR